jgi:hypothetical protein
MLEPGCLGFQSSTRQHFTVFESPGARIGFLGINVDTRLPNCTKASSFSGSISPVSPNLSSFLKRWVLLRRFAR